MNTAQKNAVRAQVENMTEQFPSNVKDAVIIFAADRTLLHFTCFQNTEVTRGAILAFVNRFFRKGAAVTDWRGSTCTVQVTV